MWSSMARLAWLLCDPLCKAPWFWPRSSPYWLLITGWFDIIQSIDMGWFGIFPSLVCFQPLRSHSRIIWKSKDASIRVWDLIRPVTPLAPVSVMPIVWGNLYNLCRVYWIYLNSHVLGMGNCRCFLNRTSKIIRLPCSSRKMMVASNRHEDLYWFRPEPYVQSQRWSSVCSSLECFEVLTMGVQEWWKRWYNLC
jgi:hypothetical protein